MTPTLTCRDTLSRDKRYVITCYFITRPLLSSNCQMDSIKCFLWCGLLSTGASWYKQTYFILLKFDWIWKVCALFIWWHFSVWFISILKNHTMQTLVVRCNLFSFLVLQQKNPVTTLKDSLARLNIHKSKLPKRKITSNSCCILMIKLTFIIEDKVQKWHILNSVCFLIFISGKLYWK